MPDLIHLAIPAFILLMVVEALAGAVMQREIYQVKDAAASITMGLGNLAADLLAKSVQFAVLTYLHRFAIFHIGFEWWAWLLLFFGDEFSYYWFHRVSHECRLFWASHVVHHSSERYNLSTALRQTWTGSFMSFVFWLWLPIVGFAPAMIMTMKAISLLYQFWIHTELVRSLGPLEAVFNTPSHHRVHHGSNPRYIDRNHGSILIVWDRLFRTFRAEHEAAVYGLTKNIRTFRIGPIATHEFRSILRDVSASTSWRQRLSFVGRGPGWAERHRATELDVPVAELVGVG